MKWIEEKDELERLINVEHVSYEEIGRRYNVTGSAIKKIARRIGIDLPQRRKINECETFNKGVSKKGDKSQKKDNKNKQNNTNLEYRICINCGKKYWFYSGHKGKYCSPECYHEYKQKEYINKWKNGEISGTTNYFGLSQRIRKYLLDKNDYKCEKCGWGEKNQTTGRIPLQIHHIDGDCLNNAEDNLQVLCPNCHSLTENFGTLNKNTSKGRSDYYKKGKTGYYEKILKKITDKDL